MDFTRRCEQCGAVIPPMAHIRRTFCSKACRNSNFNGLATAALTETKAGRICPECGGPVADHKRIDTVFCGERCRSRARHRAEKARNPLP